MIRRTTFAVIIIELFEQKGLQLIFNMYLSMIMVMYVAHFMPYSSATTNKWEIFNEVTGFIVQYLLMWLSVFPDIDVS